MPMSKGIYSYAILIPLVFLYGCGVAHVKTDVAASDLNSYESVYIQDVKVYSNEAAAKTNEPLQVKMQEWTTFTRQEFENYVRNSNYELADSLPSTPNKSLIMDFDVNVAYGNRAMRWAVGFGAGKGGVDSLLTVKDANTGEVKFKANADSDISMGGAGGDIG